MFWIKKIPDSTLYIWFLKRRATHWLCFDSTDKRNTNIQITIALKAIFSIFQSQCKVGDNVNI